MVAVEAGGKMITDEMLSEWEAMAAKATPGPWSHKAGILKHYVYSENGDLGFSLQELHPMDGREWATAETSDFIAASREAVPELIAEVRRLRDVAKFAIHASDCEIYLGFDCDCGFDKAKAGTK
jgi:hypothetical protein